MYNPFSLEGKNIIVTGASSGIGQQCAIDCSKQGAKVIIIGRNEQRLYQTSMQMDGKGHKILSLDLTDIELMIHKINETIKDIGPISGVINCAGTSSVTLLKLIKEADITAMLHTNVYSALFLTKEVCKMGNYNKAGCSIIFLSSIMGLVGDSAKTMYSLTKGALQSACRSLAIELAPKKIRVNCIAPGAIVTPINTNLPHIADPEKRAVLEAKHPLGLGQTSDISNACVYLLSDAARWITGQTIAVDGGYTAR